MTINDGLGLFGTFFHPALSRDDEPGGNYGLLDVIAALRWVRTNIGAFGGDPAKVNLFGESAGGVSIGYLMATPLAQGLFAQAIMQSGGLDVPNATGPQAKAVGRRVATILGATDAAALRNVPAQALLDVDIQAAETMPFVDGTIVREATRSAFEGRRVANIPPPDWLERRGSGLLRPRLLAGPAREDGSRTVPSAFGPGGGIRARQRRRGRRANHVRTLRRSHRPGHRPGLGGPCAHLVVPFRMAPAERARFAAGRDPHRREIPYVFDHLAEQADVDAASRALSSRLADRWGAFARTGSPELVPGDWPRLTPAEPSRLLLIGLEGETIGPNPLDPLLDALDADHLPPHP